MRTQLFALSSLLAACWPLQGAAGPLEDLSGRLQGRVGTASEDRRHDVKGPLGIKVGCRGDTLDANVRITGVSGSLESDTLSLRVTYSGTYTRQGWDVPCQRVSSDLGGVERRNVHGTYAFRVTGKPFTPPTITWGEGSSFGEVPSGDHDSNVFAIRAVQNAIASGF